ncbi:MAG: indole-3-glycerol-phosphate synthase [Woeseiaceae bacterium]
MDDFLMEMASSSRARAAEIRTVYKSSDFDLPVVPLVLDKFDLIAEIKERSPAAGLLESGTISRSVRARQYVAGGAAAISVLTEPAKFDGALSHLREVVGAVSAVPVPVMRKDFLVSQRQIEETRAAGASAVLLIAAMLSDQALRTMLDCAFEHSLVVLLESFDERDLARTETLLQSNRYSERAAKSQLLCGVNSRNLRTLAVEPQRFEALASRLPGGISCVAESGLSNIEDAATIAALGYRMALVGTALMQASDPATLIRQMLLAGRARVAA